MEQGLISGSQKSAILHSLIRVGIALTDMSINAVMGAMPMTYIMGLSCSLSQGTRETVACLSSQPNTRAAAMHRASGTQNATRSLSRQTTKHTRLNASTKAPLILHWAGRSSRLLVGRNQHKIAKDKRAHINSHRKTLAESFSCTGKLESDSGHAYTCGLYLARVYPPPILPKN